MKKARMGIKRVQKGFTLIELMIVVAIIGILAAIAIPQYQDYVTRSRWSENLTAIAPLKQAIAECAQNNALPAGAIAAVACVDNVGLATAAGGGFTAMPTAASLPNGTVTYTAGVITIVGRGQLAATCSVTLTPNVTASNVQFAVADVGCTKAQTGV